MWHVTCKGPWPDLNQGLRIYIVRVRTPNNCLHVSTNKCMKKMETKGSE